MPWAGQVTQLQTAECASKVAQTLAQAQLSTGGCISTFRGGLSAALGPWSAIIT